MSMKNKVSIYGVDLNVKIEAAENIRAFIKKYTKK